MTLEIKNSKAVIKYPKNVEDLKIDLSEIIFKKVGITTWTVPAGVTKIATLIIAGGGGGGYDVSGGGGAGGDF